MNELKNLILFCIWFSNLALTNLVASSIIIIVTQVVNFVSSCVGRSLASFSCPIVTLSLLGLNCHGPIRNIYVSFCSTTSIQPTGLTMDALVKLS